jgi:outer membrane protein assembly factor BamD (BamD/ComL family)
MNDSLLNISNEKLSTALLNAGKAYSERIYDTVKAADTFESLLKRFPSSPLVPETLYNLYKITKGGRNNKSETYRQRLIEKYPDSEFAHILSDPSYFRNKTASMEVTEKLYEEAYDYYKNEKFQAAISVTDSALAKYPDNTLAPKFMLLHSYSIARVSDEINFKEDLGRIVKSWPGTPESNKATELITYLNKKMPELKIAEDIKIATELYVIDTISSRTFALVITDPNFSTNQAAFDVISYNIDKYTNNNYKTEATLIDNKFILVTVSGFTNYNQALAYFYSFNDSKPVRNQTGVKMMTFVINRDNLRTLLEDKNPERYEIFFRENYQK